MSGAVSPRRVVVVTGGGAGIGAAIACELGRRGDHVVTVDPLVSVDGTGPDAERGPSTAESIVAAGGSAESSPASVTDAGAMSALVETILDRHGRLDGIVNAAGISRPTGFAKGDEAAWQSVLDVHFVGWMNVLAATLPHFAAAGRGRILGMTSGSGWRQADAGAYGCAKRAVASLTWQIGRCAPAGVSIGALSPIAMTRMVAAAMGAAPARPGAASGGLALGALPPPEHLGPLGAHLVGEEAAFLRGQILFAGGSEAAVLEAPRLIEVVRTSGAADPRGLVDAFLPALVEAETYQRTGGGANPRFPNLFDASGDQRNAATGTVVVVSDSDRTIGEIRTALEASGVRVIVVAAAGVEAGLDGARAVVTGADSGDSLVAVVVATTSGHEVAQESWDGILADHRGLQTAILDDARWARAVAEHAADRSRPVSLVHLAGATGPAGRTRAQVCAQLARAARGATKDRVAAFSIALETADLAPAAACLVAACAVNPAARELSGAELVAGDGWLGLRSHPRPAGALVFGGPGLPDWFDDVVAEMGL